MLAIGSSAGDLPAAALTGVERAALALLALAPAAIVPGALNRFVFGKLAIVALGVLLASMVPARGRLPRVVVGLLGAAALVLVAAALTGDAPRTQVLGLAPRYEGAIALTLYLGAVVAGGRLLGARRTPGAMAWFLDWLALAAIAVGALAALEAAGLDPLSGGRARPGSLLGNASDAGAWAVLALAPLAAAATVGRRPLHVLGALGAAGALACSGSRGALVGACAAAALVVALLPRRRAALVALGVLVLTLALAFALPDTRSRVLAASPSAADTVHGRLALWDDTTRLLAAQSLLGTGPSGYADAIPRHHGDRYAELAGSVHPPDSPHDWLLQAAAAGGVGLAALALTLAALTLASGWRAVGDERTAGEAAALVGLLAGLAGYAVALLFHFTSPGTTPLAAVYAGALLAARPREHPAASPALRRSARLAAQAALSGLLVLLLAASLAETSLRVAIHAAAAGRVDAADRAFRLAAARRPWDGAVAATAAHAYAVLATAGVPGAAAAGGAWSRDDLAAHPSSVRALSDAATLAAARGDAGNARRLLTRALALEPSSHNLRVRVEALVR